jgi:predicted PolB exonuclease-like 3'-5' exonuclease
MTADLRDILFLDIETVASTDDYHSLEERMKIQWARKSGHFKHREEGLTEEAAFHERAGIYAEFGKIIVVGIGRFTENAIGAVGLKVKSFFDHDERILLGGFKSLVEKMGEGVKLCAHNGKEFDFPYLCRRMLVNGIGLPDVLNLSGIKPWDVPHIDTMELWKFGDYKHYTSLDLLAAIFEIPSSKGSMDGSQVNEFYYKEKNLEKIAEYCLRDVIAVAQLYLRMKGLPLISSGNIQQT